jgi:pimeloyl-ACP methyl ester carboxylesterase
LAAARTVFFLPGASGDGRFWAPLARLLPSEWRKRFFAWPGLGDIPAIPDVRSLDDLVRLVLTALDGPVDLVAQSMGGVVALRAAAERPERVRHLVLAATSGGLDMRRFGAEDWQPAYVCEFPRAAPWILEHTGDLTPSLGAITAPTLLVWGDSDRISPLAVGEELLRRLSTARLIVVAGGDHSFARDRAGEFAAEVLRHLSAPSESGRRE